MRHIVFDTESNGNHDERICQLSYLICTGEQPHAKNFYFKVSHMNPYAQKVHGLSRFALESLSNGHRFKDDAEEIDRDFASADLLIGHNVRSDVRRLKQELSRCSLKLPDKKLFCTMEYFNNALNLSAINGHRKYPTLAELCDYYLLPSYSIQAYCGELFDVDIVSEHDARYDTVATYMAILAAQRRGDLRGVF